MGQKPFALHRRPHPSTEHAFGIPPGYQKFGGGVVTIAMMGRLKTRRLTTVVYEPGASGDDASQDQTGGTYNSTATTMNLASHASITASRFTAGIRFPAVAVPRGALITAATVA